MTDDCVFQLHSTLELPLEDVHDFLDNPDLPEEIDSIDFTRRNNTLIVSAVAADDTISKYTPTAQLKASVTENRVYEEPLEEQKPPAGGPRWGSAPGEEDELPPSELVEYACFKGDRETVLQNTAVQYPMFEVLCEIARIAEKGTLTAIAARNGELKATRIVDGEERPASLEVVEDPTEGPAASKGVDWRNNEFIK
ncbi:MULTISPECIES: DUF7110 family protein [Halococcus]|jgi:hypothetical protein|uniref:Uncharacterized protein n=1 Tax=Halococcus hamelinensis 100A6 TaxID=1132509 RepID=M0M200_9EURY|nr:MULTISPECIES: hypothetical protein [Halococcus]EMA38425.1 hypothetical protein C447_09732 [Halococcus hamelinensis 100A6]RJS96315.1 hypothetical protein D3261_19100 [Halococcus sp. IIIV-5B]